MTLQGALWLTIKTSGNLKERARGIVNPLWFIIGCSDSHQSIGHHRRPPVHIEQLPEVSDHVRCPLGVAVSMACIRSWYSRAKPLKAFLASSAYLFFHARRRLLGVYPSLLPATTGGDP